MILRQQDPFQKINKIHNKLVQTVTNNEKNRMCIHQVMKSIVRFNITKNCSEKQEEERNHLRIRKNKKLYPFIDKCWKHKTMNNDTNQLVLKIELFDYKYRDNSINLTFKITGFKDLLLTSMGRPNRKNGPVSIDRLLLLAMIGLCVYEQKHLFLKKKKNNNKKNRNKNKKKKNDKSIRTRIRIISGERR